MSPPAPLTRNDPHKHGRGRASRKRPVLHSLPSCRSGRVDHAGCRWDFRRSARQRPVEHQGVQIRRYNSAGITSAWTIHARRSVELDDPSPNGATRREPAGSRWRAAKLWEAAFPAPKRFVALSDALAGLETVLKVERSMSTRPPGRSPPSPMWIHPDPDPGMTTGPVAPRAALRRTPRP